MPMLVPSRGLSPCCVDRLFVILNIGQKHCRVTAFAYLCLSLHVCKHAEVHTHVYHPIGLH